MQPRIFSTAMKIYAVALDNFTNGQHVESEEALTLNPVERHSRPSAVQKKVQV